jgi:hypothetical protein
VWLTLAEGSRKSSKRLVAVRTWWWMAVSPPSAAAPRRRRCRVGARCVTGPYICSRRSTSFTGRPTSRAARMPSTCGPASSFDPKPPPMKGLRMWMSSMRMPNSAARRICVSARPCVGMSSDRRSPSQAATTPCGSIALWNCVGVS